VRELQNVVERAWALADGEVVTPRDLPDHVLGGGRGRVREVGGRGGRSRRTSGPTCLSRNTQERRMGVREASCLRGLLERHEGNISTAAKAAGINRKNPFTGS
jgi:DNA-binding NtrC family response regulator